MQLTGDLLTSMIRQESAEDLSEVLMHSSEVQTFVTESSEGIYNPKTVVAFNGFIAKDLKAKKPTCGVLSKEYSRRYVDKPKPWMSSTSSII